jgi:hypothetical protein
LALSRVTGEKWFSCRSPQLFSVSIDPSFEPEIGWPEYQCSWQCQHPRWSSLLLVDARQKKKSVLAIFAQNSASTINSWDRIRNTDVLYLPRRYSTYCELKGKGRFGFLPEPIKDGVSIFLSREEQGS